MENAFTSPRIKYLQERPTSDCTYEDMDTDIGHTFSHSMGGYTAAPTVVVLPRHLLSLIASLCKGAAKKALRATCRSFREAAQPTAIAFPVCQSSHQTQYSLTCERLAELYPGVIKANISLPALTDAVQVASIDDCFTTLASHLPGFSKLEEVEMPWSRAIVFALSAHQNLKSLVIPASLIHHPGYMHSSEVGPFAFECLQSMQRFSSLVSLDVVVGGTYSGLGLQYAMLGSLTQLKKLTIRTFMATGRLPAYGIMNMSELNSAVQTLTRLTELCFDTNALVRYNVDFECEDLQELKSFSWLRLGLSDFLPVRWVTHLTACTQLTKLVCEEVCLKPEVLEHMPLLAHLDLGTAIFKDTVRASRCLLRSCTALKNLTLYSLVVDSSNTTATLPHLEELYCNTIDSRVPLAQLAPNLRKLVQCHYEPTSANTPCMSARGHKSIDKIFVRIKTLFEDSDVIKALATVTSLRRLMVAPGPASHRGEYPIPDPAGPTLPLIRCLVLLMYPDKDCLWSVPYDICPLLQTCSNVELVKFWAVVRVDDLCTHMQELTNPQNDMYMLDMRLRREQAETKVEKSLVAVAGALKKLSNMKWLEVDVLLLVRKAVYWTEETKWKGAGGRVWLATSHARQATSSCASTSSHTCNTSSHTCDAATDGAGSCRGNIQQYSFLTEILLSLVGCPSLRHVVLKADFEESFSDVRYHEAGSLRAAWREAVEQQVEAAKQQAVLEFEILYE